MIVLARLGWLATTWIAGVAYIILGVPLGLLISIGPFSVLTGLEIGSGLVIFGLGLVARSITGSWSTGFACLGLSVLLVGFAFAAGVFTGAMQDSAHDGRLVFFWALVIAGAFFIASPAVGAWNIRRHERLRTAMAQGSIDD